MQHLSIKDNERNLSLLRIENTDSDLKVHELHYANELLKNFFKLANANKRSNNKLSKIGFGYGYTLFGKLSNALDTRVDSFLS